MPADSSPPLPRSPSWKLLPFKALGPFAALSAPAPARRRSLAEDGLHSRGRGHTSPAHAGCRLAGSQTTHRPRVRRRGRGADRGQAPRPATVRDTHWPPRPLPREFRVRRRPEPARHALGPEKASESRVRGATAGAATPPRTIPAPQSQKGDTETTAPRHEAST